MFPHVSSESGPIMLGDFDALRPWAGTVNYEVSAAVNGIEAYPVEVEVNDGFGEIMIVIVGYNTPNRP